MYERFAVWYDRLTDNVDYPARADYFEQVIARHRTGDGRLLLDLACGTGTLSLMLAQRGWDVIGVDASEDMLSIAFQKLASYEGERRPLFLCQEMEELDLYGTVDVCICALDSINHVISLDGIRRIFRRLALFLETDGLFVFDANTLYKHEHVLGDTTFVYDEEDVFCVWQNSPAEDHIVDIRLDFFEKEGNNTYQRTTDIFSERAYTTQELCAAAEEAGFVMEAVYSADTFSAPREQDERLVYVMRNKTKHQNA